MKQNPEIAPVAETQKSVTPKELAAEIGCDQKSLRSVMRRLASETPGSGGRWEIDSDFAEILRAHFANQRGNRKVVKFTPKA